MPLYFCAFDVISGVKVTEDPEACGTCGSTGPCGIVGGMTASIIGLLLGAGVGCN